jgi:putative (di)nucleoside polyphosphate hydrolase
VKPFRLNVCAVLVNEDRSQVLVFRRADNFAEVLTGYFWQFPQGGLKSDEAAEAGLLRELEEEIGTSDVDVLARAPRPIRYVYPPDVVAKLEAEGSKLVRFRGQEQQWFLARLRNGTERIHFDNEPREFDAFRWVTPAEAVRGAVPFKRAAYVSGLTALGLLKKSRPAAKRPHKPHKRTKAPSKKRRKAAKKA